MLKTVSLTPSKTIEALKAEYNDYVKIFKSQGFKRRLKALSKKLKNKKILFYGNGIYFDALADVFDLKKYFNVFGVSDTKYKIENVETYKGFKVFKPSELVNFDVTVLIAAYDAKGIFNYLTSEKLLSKNSEIEVLNKELFLEILQKEIIRLLYLFAYFLKTFDFKKTKKYFYSLITSEIKSKINYINVKRKLRKRNTLKKPLKVLFIVEENQKWQYQSLYDEFKKDRNFEVLPVLCYPIITKARTEFTHKISCKFFNDLGISAVSGYDDVAKEFIDPISFEPDLIFYPGPWYIHKFWHPKRTSNYALNYIVSYGYSSIAAETWGSKGVREVYSNMYQMFCESFYHQDFYKEASDLEDKDVTIVTGYPKFDYYFEPVNPEFEKLWKVKNAPRIIWAPHHSIDAQTRLKMGNFKEHYKFFLDFAKNNPQYSFIFKPHPFLKIKCISEKLMTEVEYDSYIQEWDNLQNAVVYDKGNYFDVFKTSDILLTDCSSFLGEYYFSKKPIVFLNKSTRCAFNDFGNKIKDTFYVVNSPEELPELLEDILINKNDYKLSERLRLIKEEYYYPDNGVGFNIVQSIKKELKIN